jgi:NAD(P)-dependent dehydrogenase (short-subunit alcohol dehydrogenase family)
VVEAAGVEPAQDVEQTQVVAASEPRIDVLINNAGAIFGGRQLTEDSLELTFALNHMA